MVVGNVEQKLERAINYLYNLPINNKDKKNIINFVKYLSAEGLSKNRQIKYVYTLGTLSRMLKKDFSGLDKKDIIELVSAINNSQYTEWTKRDFKIVIKRIMKWIREQEGIEFDDKEYPYEVKWIRTSIKKTRKKLPNELLTPEEVKKIANETYNLRDKCFCLLLYESGARIGELLNIKLKDVEFDKFGSILTLFGKTGARKIRVIASAPSISNWLNQHPKRRDKNAWLFCGIGNNTRGEFVDYANYKKMLKTSAQKAGVNKPVNPHHFRHSRATELANKFTESQLCQYMGWVQGSKEASTYVHLSGRDIDKAVLALHGLAEEEKPAEKFQTVTCPRCNVKNDPGAKFCNSCSLGLDEKSILDYDAKKDEATNMGFIDMEMLKDSKFREFYNNMLADMYKKYKEMEVKN